MEIKVAIRHFLGEEREMKRERIPDTGKASTKILGWEVQAQSGWSTMSKVEEGTHRMVGCGKD